MIQNLTIKKKRRKDKSKSKQVIQIVNPPQPQKSETKPVETMRRKMLLKFN